MTTRRLVVLTAHPELYTPRRFVESTPPGLEVRLVAPLAWWQADASREASTDDALLARPGVFSFRRILRAHRKWTRAGAHALQPRRGLWSAGDQWQTHRILAQSGLPTPITVPARFPADGSAALERVPGPPWFVKGRLGSKGSHVLLAADEAEAGRALAFLWGQGGTPLVQEDLRATGPVRRHLVVGGEVLACLESTPAEREHRSNFHRGGRLRLVTPSDAETELALRATNALQLPLAGVDLIGWDRPTVLEVNTSPGLEGAEAASGRDLAAAVLARLSIP